MFHILIEKTAKDVLWVYLFIFFEDSDFGHSDLFAVNTTC